MLFVLILVAVLGLSLSFPYVIENPENRIHLLYLLTLLAAFTFRNRIFSAAQRSESMRNAGIWAGVFLLAVFAYSFRDSDIVRRIRGELMPSQLHEVGDGSLTIRASAGGHFYVEARVNDAPVRFLVDTGASDIVLSPADARRAGFAVESLDYTHRYNTANGSGRGAAVVMDKIAIGPLRLQKVKASVNQAQMEDSLLGMSFLSRLRSFRVEGNTLVLIP